MNDTQVIDREQEIVFTNYTDEDFEGKWNKKIYLIKAHKSYYLPFYLAEHFGKHLVDREINKMAAMEVEKITTANPAADRKIIETKEKSILTNVVVRQELMDRCVELKNPATIDAAQTRVVQMREARPLKTQIRSKEYVDKGIVSPGDLGSGNQPPKTEEGFQT